MIYLNSYASKAIYDGKIMGKKGKKHLYYHIGHSYPVNRNDLPSK